MRLVLLACALSGLALSCAEPRPDPLPQPEREGPVTQVTSGRAGEDKDPEISPDGKVLYYVSSSFGDQLDLYMKVIGTNTAIRLTTFPGDKRFPKVNPVNPRIVAFCTNTRGSWEIGLLDVQGDSSRVEFVSEAGTEALHPSWSPDGRRLVYCATDDISNGDWTLRIRDFTTRKTISLESVDGLLPEWSPRGNTIVFQRMKHRDGWQSSIWTLQCDGDQASNLSSVFSSDDWAAINPSWSQDGRQILFATVGKSPARSAINDEADDIWRIDADGSNATRLTFDPAADWMPTGSSEGRIYFVSKRSGTNRIWSIMPGVAGIP